MRAHLVIAALCAVGCRALPDGDVGRSAAHEAVVKLYDQALHFDEPRACDVYLERRTTDEQARTVEYDARIDGRPVSIVYSIVAGDPFPLQVALYDGAGAAGFSVVTNDHTLQVRDGDGNVRRTVAGYDGHAASTTIEAGSAIDDADGLALLGCALPGRAALGDVAAFLRNLASGGAVAGQPDVGQSSANAPPLLPDWQGNVSLLGAFWLASGCLDATGWSCGCWTTMNDPIIGHVDGWCP